MEWKKSVRAGVHDRTEQSRGVEPPERPRMCMCISDKQEEHYLALWLAGWL
jgi:hypothetical protein